jgi:hypothetical protein
VSTEPTNCSSGRLRRSADHERSGYPLHGAKPLGHLGFRHIVDGHDDVPHQILGDDELFHRALANDFLEGFLQGLIAFIEPWQRFRLRDFRQRVLDGRFFGHRYRRRGCRHRLCGRSDFVVPRGEVDDGANRQAHYGDRGSSPFEVFVHR